VGSNPSVGSITNLQGYSSGQRGLTVNQLAFAYGGSNPSPCTKHRLITAQLEDRAFKAHF
jgi:hypothetical protein